MNEPTGWNDLRNKGLGTDDGVCTDVDLAKQDRARVDHNSIPDENVPELFAWDWQPSSRRRPEGHIMMQHYVASDHAVGANGDPERGAEAEARDRSSTLCAISIECMESSRRRHIQLKPAGVPN